MRERFRTIIENLPPTGIAIHGTTLERALRIQKEGFDPNMIHTKYGYYKGETFYIAQPPHTPHPSRTLGHLTGKFGASTLKEAIFRSYVKAQEENGKQALVLFKPNMMLPEELMKQGIPRITHDPSPISAGNVLGIVEVGNGKTRMDKEIFRDCVALLQDKGVINVGTSQPTK